METPEDVQGRLNGCHLALDDLEKALDPLLSASQQEVETQLGSPLQRARLSVALAHASLVLFQVYLKSQCVNVAEHPVAKEAERMERYHKRVVDAISASQARPRSMAIDVKATKRVIAHEVSDLSEEQKKKLRKGK